MQYLILYCNTYPMKKLLPLFLSIFLFANFSTAQIYLEPIVGYHNGLNNNGHFSQINSAIQFSFISHRNKRRALSLQLQKSFALPYHATDSSFSLNPLLPLYSQAKKTIKASNYSFSIARHFTVIESKSKSALNILLGIGISHQHISVDYDYDKSNYTLLNPDQTQDITSLFLNAGLEYVKTLKVGRIVTQITFSTRAGKNKFPSSFGFMAPVSLNLGYSILIQKKKK